jgi:hypothetical protein
MFRDDLADILYDKLPAKEASKKEFDDIMDAVWKLKLEKHQAAAEALPKGWVAGNNPEKDTGCWIRTVVRIEGYPRSWNLVRKTRWFDGDRAIVLYPKVNAEKRLGERLEKWQQESDKLSEDRGQHEALIVGNLRKLNSSRQLFEAWPKAFEVAYTEGLFEKYGHNIGGDESLPAVQTKDLDSLLGL